jgi:heptosyltransferase-2
MHETISQLRAENFDVIIDLHHNLRSLRIKYALRPAHAYSFNKLNIQKWLLTFLKLNVLPKKHIVERYLETVKIFGVHNDGRGLDYFIPPHDIVPAQDIPTSHQAGFIAIVIGAALETKQLPLHKLQELCSIIVHPIILLGGKEDAMRGNAIAAMDLVKIYNACGKFNLNESADLLRRAKAVITHDTGLMHIAAALKKPVITVWGNTLPQFGMSVYYGNTAINNYSFEINNLYCRPCSKIGYHTCPHGHFRCMELQPIHQIAEALNDLIKR